MFDEQFTQITHDSKARLDINKNYRADENEVLKRALEGISFSEGDRHAVDIKAKSLVMKVREKRLGGLGLDAFFIQYDLSSEEGIALMCLAEAMLRIPDADNVDALIQDKLTNLQWHNYKGGSSSWFIQAATWGLIATDKLYDKSKGGNPLKSLVAKVGEPVVRQCVKKAMGLLGEQFILGHSIEHAIKRANKKDHSHYLYSYDMLGEAAKTAEDAERYFMAYQQSIEALAVDKEGDLLTRPGISIKLSALHPRYQMSQYHRAVPAITQKVLYLVKLSMAANITVTLDAEESDRLDMSLQIFEEIIKEPTIAAWGGFGLAVQAYQKRALDVIDHLAGLAQQHECRILVRLVKGAYWDTEIKQSQMMGFSDYPVFTRKYNTDVNYIACMQRIAKAEQRIYGQFATHNAHTVASVLQTYGTRTDYEFQCLHGMGRTLYDVLLASESGIHCRMYAPVGSHEELLPYLVRRLLENGANSSFVNKIIDKRVPIERIVQDPIAYALKAEDAYHPHIPRPCHIFPDGRLSASGADLNNLVEVLPLAEKMSTAAAKTVEAPVLISGLKRQQIQSLEVCEVTNPADRSQVVGKYREVNATAVDHAIATAKQYTSTWQQTTVAERAALLRKIADELEGRASEFMALAVIEAGKQWQDAVDEVREAVDFLRYYANEAESKLVRMPLPGPTGEYNELHYVARGVVFCISPWNFPLAIFCGQISAALVTGNVVVAKPAPQTVLIASRFVELMQAAGLPKEALQLIPGATDVAGKAVIEHPHIDAVMLTGSNTTAKNIAHSLVDRKGPIVPLIAETGGMNCMIVDSTALTEQVVQDVLDSAFKSAGQRCSALRVLYLQEDIADKTIDMLIGAMKELVIGDPKYLATDIGPVIDETARQRLQDHVAYLEEQGATLLHMCAEDPKNASGTYFMPRVYKIPSINILDAEVFGPVLHIIRYPKKALDAVIDEINDTGYGLTFGIHSRVSSTIDAIQSRMHVGNVYINRNIVGAVVGVQPFGGEGLSGTGPKAGGPNYLMKLCHERTVTINTTAVGGNTSLMTLDDPQLS